ncbi:MAG: hypothetical protein KAR83_05470, partial [Thermodesulfovibrionales bacterium]|nr:hypothetical protein [Thermodesulfovibrionales bacterium]
MRARMIVGSVELDLVFDDTETARAVYGALPLESGFNVWGDEF